MTILDTAGAADGNTTPTSGRDGDAPLRFTPETAPMRTPFRDAAIDFIYRRAAELSKGRLVSATVLFKEDPFMDGGPSSLDLALHVDDDWDAADKIGSGISEAICEIAKTWPRNQFADFNTHIYFSVAPARR